MIGATGAAGNNSLCSGAVLEQPVAAAYNSLNISTLHSNDCQKSLAYPKRPVGSMGPKGGSRGWEHGWDASVELQGNVEG